ncbi:hypothetical protein ASG89_05325 [Paenibacillus sp. Soil766]|uniref:response regulator transcription factor n=1 Tax=Paenibacillus sp. Soil766 TaxID=1736404 RepID=UPI00070EDA51|nr:response regulator [Paenibacillus sp. Soil766]KRE98429.1 hypothetical protein ASG89_05325 [Paenibacillus sp. Soil766]
MINLLIVDDEEYTVRALYKAIDWGAEGITTIYDAADSDEAMSIIQQHKVDLMICDIEMPGMNGLELQEWVNVFAPSMVTVFLTGHADFTYAQRAIQQGGFDYLLKPVKRDHLRKVVEKAVSQVKQEKEWQHYNENVQKYTTIWEKQKPVIIERFWQDVLDERIRMNAYELEQSLVASELALTTTTLIVPILISVERWDKEFTLRDEEIMNYALRNVASEMLLGGHAGTVIQDRSGLNLALCYVNENLEALPWQDWEKACTEYAHACARYLYCTVSCFIGKPTVLTHISQTVYELIDTEHEHVSGHSIIRLVDSEVQKPTNVRQFTIPVAWEEWIKLFESGKRTELTTRLQALFVELRESDVDAEIISAVYHSLLNFIYHAAHKKGWPVKMLLPGGRRGEEKNPPRSLNQLQTWAERLFSAAMKQMAESGVENLALIETIKAYIQEDLNGVTRERIAAYVHLNAAYLSRIFKKETGQSMMDYIIAEKMKQAKVLLIESRTRISDICEQLGYENFSHFSKMFKRVAGMTPQEYRKSYQSLYLDSGSSSHF